jgi:urease accessory protein
MRMFVLTPLLLLFPALVFASSGSIAGGFSEGFSHPVLGFDHLLAMLSVGVLSAQMGGRAIWTIPSVFVGMMLVGGVMGIYNVGLISVELGISISVFVLGIALAIDRRLPMLLIFLVVSFFAIFHGYAHGEEMPILANPTMYALGFASGTATIHLAGVFIGVIARRVPSGLAFLRYVGAGVAGIGVHLLVGL